MNASLVSVIVACYNQGEFLAEALDSVLVQSYENWECIIVNDGSPDNTEEVALKYCEKDERFIYLKKENGGISSARNEGIKQSSGIYILPLDADDRIGREYLEKAVAILDSDSKVKLVYGAVELFGNETGIWDLPEYSLHRLTVENMIHSSAFFRRSDFDLYGGYDESFVFGLEDWEFWLKILKGGGEVKKLPSVHFYYRKKENSRIRSLLNNDNWNITMRNKLYSKHSDVYTHFYGDLIMMINDKAYLEEQLKEKQRQIEQKIAETKLIYESASYRLGNFIIKPLKIFSWKK